MMKELQFFGANAVKPQSDHSYDLLVVDFDETCTETDTLKYIINAAINKPDLNDHEKMTQARLCEQLVGNYITERKELFKSIFPNVQQRSTIAAGQWLDLFINQLHEFDTKMNEIVVESKVLSGITIDSLYASSSSIKLKSKCIETLRHALDRGMHVVILSVNWSSQMIEYVFNRAGFSTKILQDVRDIDSQDQRKVHIIANLIDFKNEKSSGQIHRSCESAADKRRIFKSMIARNTTCSRSIYIGDSVTDIGPLTEASLGIVMGQNDTLMDALRIAGMSVSPLERYSLPQSNPESFLYHTDSWDKIYGFISGINWCPHTEKSLVHQVPRVMLISGSDSGGGAGLQADIKTCIACGAFPTNAVSAITVQNSHGVSHIHTVPGGVLRDQMRAIQDDIGSSCIKIGMLGSIENVKMVSEELRRMKHRPPIILDPVLVSSSGSALAEQGLAAALKEHLFPLATIITPNISEASELLEDMMINDIDSMRLAAKKLYKLGPKFVLVKGGHCMDSNLNATDILFNGTDFVDFSKAFLDGTNNHGTGCALSSAIASYISKGETVIDSVACAKDFVWRSMEQSSGICLGSGDQKAMNLAYHADDWKNVRSISRVPNSIDVSLYAVSSPLTTSQEKSDDEILETIREVVRGGATVIQIRDKVSEGGHLTRIVSKLVRFCRPQGVKVIVNDRVDVCIASDACGVHVGQGDIPAAVVRRMIGPDKILGVSCKTVELALKAEMDGADYVGCGAVFDTPTKQSSKRIGIEGVKVIRDKVSIPVVAIGGLDETNIQETIIGSNCHGVAVVRAIFDAEDVQRSTETLRYLTDSALHGNVSK